MSSPIDSTGTAPVSCPKIATAPPLAVKGRQLVESLKPFMVSKDTARLHDFLQHAGYDEPTLIALLTCSDLTIVRAATWTLAHIGSMAANLPLASILHHDDAATVDLAENALWSVWLRGAPLNMHKRLCAAIRMTEQDCIDKAHAEMDGIVRTCPDFAEAFDQRAIARFLKSDYSGAIDDYQRTCALNPVHFGALAGIGHCYAAQGRYADALNAYRRVLGVHPRMEGIRQAIGQIKRMMTHSPRLGCIPTNWALD